MLIASVFILFQIPLDTVWTDIDYMDKVRSPMSVTPFLLFVFCMNIILSVHIKKSSDARTGR